MIEETNTLKIFVCDKVKVTDKVLGVSVFDTKDFVVSEPIMSPYVTVVFNPARSWAPCLARAPEVSTSVITNYQWQFA